MEFKTNHIVASTDFIMVDLFRKSKCINFYNSFKRSEKNSYSIGAWHVKLKPNVKHSFLFEGLSNE